MCLFLWLFIFQVFRPRLGPMRVGPMRLGPMRVGYIWITFGFKCNLKSGERFMAWNQIIIMFVLYVIFISLTILSKNRCKFKIHIDIHQSYIVKVIKVIKWYPSDVKWDIKVISIHIDIHQNRFQIAELAWYWSNRKYSDKNLRTDTKSAARLTSKASKCVP